MQIYVKIACIVTISIRILCVNWYYLMETKQAIPQRSLGAEGVCVGTEQDKS